MSDSPLQSRLHAPATGGQAVPTDGRLRRGARSRRTILRHAVDVASLDGLNGLSLGRLASDLGLSKSGVQTLFGTKENLQVATAALAREVFEDSVIRPAGSASPGVARLRALIERWIAYAQAPLFPGGCFWAANLADFDGRPGPVQEILVGQQRGWRERIGSELRHAAAAGQITDLDADLAAFQIDAVLIAANTAMRLGEKRAADDVRRVLEGLLATARPRPARRSARGSSKHVKVAHNRESGAG
jgi:AcrR family transcriptional regulator